MQRGPFSVASDANVGFRTCRCFCRSLVPKLRAGIVGDAGWLGNVSLGQNFHPAGGQFVKAPDDA